ncbi:hypothetical protein Nepgr_031289 [Nepenthes gracilis]|uniref:Protein PRD1 n=1 Tax=Nepenthes gracilis TaxID=150966 RepID=A0AAD3Y7E2_NEPGR|nr:hypothetical protein Nepgr_031289 [Nepenthes gracilis]
MYYYPDSHFEDFSQNSSPELSDPSLSCAQGHRPSLILQTQEGGCICLLCFSNLISNPSSPTFQVSYALSQLSHAICQPDFLQNLLTFHVHIIMSPLVQCLSSFDDEPIAVQIIDLIFELCNTAGDSSVFGEFVARIADQLSTSALAWNRRQVYVLHCLGMLLNCEMTNLYAYIKDENSLINNLVNGLQLPSEEIQGEILFVLFKISILQCASEDDEGADLWLTYCPKLLHLSLEVLLKTQSDDVRLNCIALLKVLAQRGFLDKALSSDFSMMGTCEADNFIQITHDGKYGPSLSLLLAEAIKGPLLSSDSRVQIATLDFIFHCLSWEGFSSKHVQVFVEENIVDYIFEVLRLSGTNDQVVSSCILVLHLFSMAGQIFKQKLAIGFTTLVSVLSHVAEVPFHPVQTEVLKLILNGVSNFPGIVSTKQMEEISCVLTAMLRSYINGEMGMLSEAFMSACSIFVALMKFPFSTGTLNLLMSIQEASRYAVLGSLSAYDKDPSQLFHSLYLLRESCAFSHETNSINSSSGMQPSNWVIELCQNHILPWFMMAIKEMEEESILGVLETFHFILAESCDTLGIEFARILLSLSWFHLSFGWLSLYPTEKMKWRVYLIFSSIVDCHLGNGCGQPIRDAASSLPTDPIDMLFLLGQKSVHNQEQFSCQTAVLQILYISSLYNEMIADKKFVLASLEQYIIVNGGDLLYGSSDSLTTIQLMNLYGLYRGLAKQSYQISYSPEAEKIFFQLVVEKDLDLFSVKIHPTSLKWLFQQERIIKPLSCQILQFCRKSSTVKTQNINDRNHCQYINAKDIAELVAVGDNLMAKLLVILLKQFLEEEIQMDDVVLVLNLMSSIICIVPSASDQLYMNDLGSAVQKSCHNLIYSSPQNRILTIRFIFIFLISVQPETLSDDEAWLAVTMTLLDSFILAVAETGWTNESLLLSGVLSMILHHSTHKALGIASIYQPEATNDGKPLVFLLLLNCYYLRSLQAVLPGSVDWQNFLSPSDMIPTFPSMGILCQDFCRLIHSGPPLVKLIASYCLLELFARITNQRNGQQKGIKCTVVFLRTIVAVLEGLVFHSDVRVAMNCGLCLSTILSWEVPGLHKTGFIGTNSWCKVIVEELANSLVAPCSFSQSFMIHHKAAVHIAAALLKLTDVPGWMRSVFDDSCISAIIQNLSPNSVSAEVVLLFRELLHSGFLKSDQITSLSHVFLACRKRIYVDDCRDERTGQQTRKVISLSCDLRDVCEFLIHLVLSESSLGVNSSKTQVANGILSAEVELFLKSLTEDMDV